MRELVQEVRAACQEQIVRVAESRDVAVEAIKAVLDPEDTQYGIFSTPDDD